MKKKVAISVAVIILVFTAVSMAGSINGEFKGFSVVNVIVNGTKIESEVPAVNFFGKTVLPIRNVAEALNVLVDWEQSTQTAKLVKPHVNMIFAENIEEDEQGSDIITNPFSLAEVGTAYNFYTYTSISDMPLGNCKYRVVVENAKGEAVFTTEENEYNVEDNSGFVTYYYYENFQFDLPGDYLFKFQVENNGEFKTIHESRIIAY